MGVTEEGTAMSDENKNKAILPDKKGVGLFYFRLTKECLVRWMCYKYPCS